MALNKVNYVDGETVITAENMNDIQDAIIALEETPAQGVSDDLKQALLQLAQKVAYVDEHGADYYQDLYDALYPPAGLLSITATFTQGSTIIYDDADLDDLRPMLYVVGHYDDNTDAEVTNYDLSGSLTVGSSVVTVSYQSKTTTFTVNVTARPTLSSITAVYTQSGTVYTTDSLDSLKDDLVVTAHYADSSTQTVPATDYVLSGTLTVGTSTITVTYQGKTTTFSVTVSEEPIPSEYQQVEYLQTAPTASGTGAWINSGITCPNNPSSLTFVADCAPEATTWSKCIIGTRKLGGGANDMGFQLSANTANTAVGGWSGDPGAYLYPEAFTKRATYEATWTSSGITITDGENTESSSYTTRSIGGYPICIFACKNASNTAYANSFKGRIYSAKIIIEGTLYGEFIPCYRKNDSAVGFYNLMNESFCGVSDGSLISAGPDVS